MKILIMTVTFALAWVVVGAIDDLSGYHAATDTSVWVPRIHDMVTLLWGTVLGAMVARIVVKR